MKLRVLRVDIRPKYRRFKRHTSEGLFHFENSEFQFVMPGNKIHRRENESGINIDGLIGEIITYYLS